MASRPLGLHGLWLLLLPAVVAATTLKRVDHGSWPTKYDPHFRKYAKRYFGPAFDWRWFKAQAIAESMLKPHARNPSGATGLMQILPSTFNEIRAKNPQFRSIKEPRWNIAAGIYYDRQLHKRWGKTISDGQERLNFTFAAYNAGFGRINKATSKAGEDAAGTWAKVAPHAPGQTRHYVKKVRHLMGKGPPPK